ncbi:MAG: hypothetical protein C0618_12290 [Desulfuromonas sp.]|nr:MAG: hypothetical protein C0618_12290 [Desulfuromonas sp.]
MKSIIASFFIALLLTACNGGQPEELKSPEFYFQEGESYLERGLYDNAIESWEKVRDSFYSPELTMKTELKMAETYYLAERYPEAASAYRDFIQQYPGDNRNGSATYWLAMSYYQQILTKDRDQTSTRNALNVFRRLLAEYPGERDIAEINELMAYCRNRLAAHEVYIGTFYLRTKHYQPAVDRLEAALAQYPDYPRHDRTYEALVSAYLNLNRREQAEDAFARLTNAYPDSDALKKASRKLAK